MSGAGMLQPTCTLSPLHTIGPFVAIGVFIGHLKSHEYMLVDVSEVIMPSQTQGII